METPRIHIEMWEHASSTDGYRTQFRPRVAGRVSQPGAAGEVPQVRCRRYRRCLRSCATQEHIPCQNSMMRYADHQQTMCSRAHTPLPAPLCRAHRGQDHPSSEGPTKPVKALGRPASDDAMPLCLAGPSALAEWLGHSKWLCRTITLCLYNYPPS